MALPKEVMFQNQLQFNLHVPLTTSNISTHFHPPKPIVVERLAGKAEQGAGFPIIHLNHKRFGKDVYPPLKVNVDAPQTTFQFSTLSEDRLAAAVELAKRDLKKMNMQQVNVKEPEDGQGKQGKSKIVGSCHQEKVIHGQKYWEGLKNKTKTKTKPVKGQKGHGVQNSGRMKAKEHDRNREPCDSSTQTPTGSPARQAFLSNKPASTQQERADSPPTRDTPSRTRLARVPKDEIEKLQLEMEMYLQQIESVERRALSERSTDFLRRGHHSGSRGGSELLEDEGEERWQVRAGEQIARASRNIYNLRQQVKQIERDILIGPSSTRATKKSQAAARLAAAHRGAVRALQMFVNQLPYQDLRGGLPSHYHELSLLIRQLTMLSAQIPLTDPKTSKDSREKNVGGVVKVRKDDQEESSREGTSDIQNDLMAMLDRVEQLNLDWCREMKSHDPHIPRKGQKPPFVTNFNTVKQPFSVEKVAGFQRNEFGRRALLQASVRALLGSLEQGTGKHLQKHQKKKSQSKKMMAWDVAAKKRRPSKKGLMQPGKARRQQMALQVQQQPQRQEQKQLELNTHFADPTITASLKATAPLQNPFISQPGRSLSAPSFLCTRKKEEHFHSSYPGTQRRSSSHCSLSSQSGRSQSHSPWRKQDRSRSPSPTYRRRSKSPQGQRQRFFVQDADNELIDELFPRQKILRQSRKKSKQQEDSSGKSFLKKADVSESFISEVERRVINRLKPLLDEAKDHGRQSDEDERERLAEMILDDVVEEATQELQAMEEKERVHKSAAYLLDNPTLENIHQRLEEMEKEHLEIRQRWASINYHDSVPTRRWKPASENLTRPSQPREPTAFEVTRMPSVKTSNPCGSYPDELVEEPLLFTKESKVVQPRVTFEQRTMQEGRPTLVNEGPPLSSASKITPKPRKLLSMKQAVVEKIYDHAERFDYFQKGLKHHLGRKEGWRVIESLADQILDDCLQDVAVEVENISAAMADHIYTSEFMDQSGLPLAPPELAADFISGGSAAQNLRDSAAAMYEVEDTFARMALSSERLQHIASPEPREGTSPVNPMTLRNVFDATALFEASANASRTEDMPAYVNKSKEDDTQVVDYDDDFSDLTDEEDETDDERSNPIP